MKVERLSRASTGLHVGWKFVFKNGSSRKFYKRGLKNILISMIMIANIALFVYVVKTLIEIIKLGF